MIRSGRQTSRIPWERVDPASDFDKEILMRCYLFNRSVYLRAFAGALLICFAAASLAQAGGAACACEELLRKLNPNEIPAALQLPQKDGNILGAIDVGDRQILALGFLHYGKILAVAEAGPPNRNAGPAGRVLLYDLSGSKPQQIGQLDATSDQIVAMATHPYQHDLLITGGGRWDSRLRSFQHTSKDWKSLTSVEPFSKWWLRAMAFSPDGNSLATVAGDDEGTLRLWDVSEGKLEKHQALNGMSWAPSAIAFSPNGHFLAAGTGSSHSHANDGRILVWDLTANPAKLVAETSAVGKGQPVDVTSLVFTDNHRLVSADQAGQIRTWTFDPASGLKADRQFTGHANGVQSLHQTRDQKLVSSGHDGCVTLWNAGKQVQRWDFNSESAVTALAPSGRHCAVGLADGRVYILQTGPRQ